MAKITKIIRNENNPVVHNVQVNPNNVEDLSVLAHDIIVEFHPILDKFYHNDLHTQPSFVVPFLHNAVNNVESLSADFADDVIDDNQFPGVVVTALVHARIFNPKALQNVLAVLHY